MSTEAFRNSIMAEVHEWHQDNFSDYFVQYENGPEFDEEPEDTAKPWMDVALRFYSGIVTTVGANPRGRYSGVLALYVYTRRGEGTALSDQIIDSFIKTFKFRSFGPGYLSFPERSIPTDHYGWHKVGLFIPFKLDEKGG